jgi:hypothetical protein
MKGTLSAALLGLVVLGSTPPAPVRAEQPADVGTAVGVLDLESFAATERITLAEAQRRLEERLELDSAIEFIASNRSTFGGVYIDQGAGGVLDIAVPKDAQDMRAALSKLLPSGASVRWRTVEHSLSDLDEVRDALISEAQNFEQAGAPIASVAIDVPPIALHVIPGAVASRSFPVMAAGFSARTDTTSARRVRAPRT